MTWVRQSTRDDVYVELSLDQFTEKALLQGLINAEWISEDEAAAIAERAETKKAQKVLSAGPVDVLDISPEDIELARYFALSGRKQDALIYLERALGREFHGRLA